MTTVTYNDIVTASKILQGIVHCTPVLTSSTINAKTKNDVFFKCENFQRMGAFKIRGAYNAMHTYLQSGQLNGVLTYSSGNHAQAIALAGKLLHVKTTIIMPENAPQVKINATKEYGAEIIFYNPQQAKREELAAQIAAERKLTIIPPYDHPYVIAGQGTVAKELFEETGELDFLLTPCGGGGLLSGSAIVVKALFPKCKVIGVEPENADDATKSFYSKKLHTIDNPNTIADGARTPFLGKHTFPLILSHVDEMITVSENAICESMFYLWERMKIVVEPTAALAFAALHENKLATANKKIGIIISGGNVDVRNIPCL